MGRNSNDNSLGRFLELQEITKNYAKRKKTGILTHFPFNKFVKESKRVIKIDKACQILSDPYRTIIINTFLIKKDIYWWSPLYSKTTYYRLRNMAINSFLEAYKLLWLEEI